MQETNNQPPTAPPKKSTSGKKILVWILLILGGLFILIALIIGGTAYYGYTKMKEMGLTPTMLGEDPGTAFGKVVEATNENIEFVSSDKDKGEVTFRNKTTGETITVDFESIKAGKLPEGLDPSADQSSAEEEGVPAPDQPEQQ